MEFFYVNQQEKVVIISDVEIVPPAGYELLGSMDTTGLNPRFVLVSLCHVNDIEPVGFKLLFQRS